MVLIVLPDWTIELEEKLDKVIKDISVKHHIDFVGVDDSRDIVNGKSLIADALVRLYWYYNVENRKRLEESEEVFKKHIKKAKKKVMRRKTTIKKRRRR